ncbi:MAG: YceI family protein, partial [Verrucomicrobiota bacterium]
AAFCLIPSFNFTVSAADTYEASAGMSYILFKVRHFGVSNAYGRFNEFTGTVTGDPATPGDTTVEFEVAAASVDTGIEDRDNHLRGPDFFNAKEFPQITFKSTALEAIDGAEGIYKLTGDLTMLGVTKPVTAEFAYFGTGTGVKGTAIAGAEATFVVKRTEFGMNYGAPDALGDEVTITVALQGAKK